MISLKNVSKSFYNPKDEIHAVRNVNLSIQDGDVFGIIGFSGAGKSTLVRCINLLERPEQGIVEVGGYELTTLSEKNLRQARKKIGMIFQHFNLMQSRTVFENVAYPLRRSGLSRTQIQHKVQKLLTLANIGDKENAYPSQLSGGQKQRVAIARALANDPQVLLCDEATSALDPQTTKSILQLLKQLNKQLGITIVVITHEMAVVKAICNKVAVMEKGRVVETGNIFSVFSNPKHEVTRDFIRATSSLQKIEEIISSKAELADLKPGEVIVRLSYIRKNTSEPLISIISRKFEVNINVIFADIEIIEGAPIGGTVAIISGECEQVSNAIKFLNEKEVEVEVLKDARDNK